jgi:four helix bundle protein
MIYDLTADFPSDEKFGLISQMRRAAVSIPANIAEGFGRKSKKELINFMYIASGSISELDTHFEIAKRLGYPVKNEVRDLLKSVRKMLFGLILSLKGSRK